MVSAMRIWEAVIAFREGWVVSGEWDFREEGRGERNVGLWGGGGEAHIWHPKVCFPFPASLIVGKRGRRCSLPRNESKYPFASFCNRVAAPSMVLYRLSSTS